MSVLARAFQSGLSMEYFLRVDDIEAILRGSWLCVDVDGRIRLLAVARAGQLENVIAGAENVAVVTGAAAFSKGNGSGSGFFGPASRYCLRRS